MTGGVKHDTTNPWLVEEPEETRGLGFADIQQQQRRIIEGETFFLIFAALYQWLHGSAG